LIGETPAEPVTQKSREERSQHHPEKCDGNELRVLAERGKAALQRRAQDGRGEVHVKAIEKHSDGDESHDAPME
jgi:hypothetical protein